jgi:8-oxo-dGTP diphosphatase
MERNMYLDKEKAVKAFMGTGEKNAAGEDLVTFLEKYDPHKYQNPCNTVDMAVFAYNESEKKVTKVLLIQRGNHPSIGWWADLWSTGKISKRRQQENYRKKQELSI